MTNYDTEIRRIAEEVRHILNNCTDAPRLLREYAGLYTEEEAQRVIAAPLTDDINELRTEVKGLYGEIFMAEAEIMDLKSQLQDT